MLQPIAINPEIDKRRMEICGDQEEDPFAPIEPTSKPSTSKTRRPDFKTVKARTTWLWETKRSGDVDKAEKETSKLLFNLITHDSLRRRKKDRGREIGTLTTMGKSIMRR